MTVNIQLDDLEQSYSDICYQYGKYPYDAVNKRIIECAENALISMGFDIMSVLNIKNSKYRITRLPYMFTEEEYERFCKD